MLRFLRYMIPLGHIGGHQRNQEMLEFSAKHNIVPDIEIIKMQDINKAWESLVM